jgi:hypothetical protein
MHNIVGYVTDVEGNLEFWEKYITHSKVLYRDIGGDNSLHLRDNCQFVYGGDSCDRGIGDIQVIRELVQLKDRYPERVHLIMGNRDINKLRLPVTLLDATLMLKPSCYWSNEEFDAEKNLDYKFDDRVSKMKWVIISVFYLRKQVIYHVVVFHRFYVAPWAVPMHLNIAVWNSCEWVVLLRMKMWSIRFTVWCSRVYLALLVSTPKPQSQVVALLLLCPALM